MKYFVATIFSRGKRLEVALYAKDKKEANEYVKLKYDATIIKIIHSKEPIEVELKRALREFAQNIKKRKIEPDALVAAIRQLAVMTNAGISIHDSLSEISTSSEDSTLKHIFKKLADDIDSGHSLSSSMQNFHFELGSLSIAMVKLGEKTGNLDEALYTLANMLEEIRNNLIKFKKAMAYPRNVLVAIVVAFSILLSYVVPKFKDIFEQLNTQLPLPTQILLKLQHIFNSYGLYILVASILSLIIFKYLISNHQNIRLTWHRVLLRTYLIKDIIRFSTLSRFTLVFSELIRAGIPIVDALETSSSMVESLPLKMNLSSVRLRVEKGGTLKSGLEESRLFENMILQMVRAGEDSGRLDAMMQKVANYYKMKFDALIDSLSEAIEPILLLIIATMIILLALGIFLPIWSMGSALGSGA